MLRSYSLPIRSSNEQSKKLASLIILSIVGKRFPWYQSSTIWHEKCASLHNRYRLYLFLSKIVFNRSENGGTGLYTMPLLSSLAPKRKAIEHPKYRVMVVRSTDNASAKAGAQIPWSNISSSNRSTKYTQIKKWNFLWIFCYFLNNSQFVIVPRTGNSARVFRIRKYMLTFLRPLLRNFLPFRRGNRSTVFAEVNGKNIA